MSAESSSFPQMVTQHQPPLWFLSGASRLLQGAQKNVSQCRLVTRVGVGGGMSPVGLVSVGVTAWLLRLMDTPLPVIQFTFSYQEAPPAGDADSSHPILLVYGVLPQADSSSTNHSLLLNVGVL